jgi:predicted LPLAT superfamily acyltransferase
MFHFICVWNERRQFTLPLFASEIKQYSGKSKEVLRTAHARGFAGEMERKLRRYPEQWFNYYNFWQQ